MKIAKLLNTGIRKARHALSTSIRYARDYWEPRYRYDVLPPEELRAALNLPFVRKTLIQFSRDEYERNPYYANVINNLSNHTIGPTPTIIGMSDKDEYNNKVEDAYLEWSSCNGIGKTFRELRKEAALTGLGIAIPYKNTETSHAVSLAYKTFGMDALETPKDIDRDLRVIDGIEYDEDWSPIKFYFKTEDDTKPPKEYTTREVLFWTTCHRNGSINPVPECYAAFSIYPYVRRFLEAVIKAEEFKASVPMAVEVDGKYYSVKAKNDPPMGLFEYEPNMIPTLPVGTKLASVPPGTPSSEKHKLIRLMASTCALTVQMPANLALGDSSDSNMASAQVDTQPWKNKVNIDRFDMEPMFRRSFYEWWFFAVRKEDLVPAMMRRTNLTFFPHTYVYDDLFSHPDPLKNANARAVDLISGSTTLQRIYSQLGKNPKRELQSEARLLGISYEELCQVVLASRTTLALQILGIANANQQSDQRAEQSNAA